MVSAKKTVQNGFLTNTEVAIYIQVEAKSALAAVTQTTIICSVTEDADLFTAPIVTATWIGSWRGENAQG